MNYTFAVIALAEFLIAGMNALFVLARAPKERLNRLFFCFSMAIAFTALTDFMMKITGSASFALLCIRLQVFTFLYFIAFLSHFCLILAGRGKLLKNALIYILIYLPHSVMGVISWNTGLFYTGVEKGIWGYSQQFASHYWILAVYSIIYFMALLWLSLQAWLQAAGRREKMQNRIIFVGLILTFILSAIFEGMLRVFGMHYPPLIVPIACLGVIFFAYAIVRHGLLAVTPASLAQNIINTMPVFMIFNDPQERVLLVNQNYLRSFGFSSEEVIGRKFTELHEHNHETEHQQIMQALSRNGLVKDKKMWLKKKSGEKVPVAMEASLVFDRFGEEIGTLHIFRDISEEQRLIEQQRESIDEMNKNKLRLFSLLEDTAAARDDAKKKSQDLARALDDLQAVDRMKTDFLSVMSHELRTPLTPIMGYISMFLNEQFGKLTPEYKRGAEIILKESRHLITLIDGVLDISRIERGKTMELNKEPVSMKAMINGLMEVMQPQFDALQMKIEAAIPEDFPVVMADASKIQRVLTNLLGNALKFTPKGGTIKVVGLRQDKAAQLQIIDNGIGIAQDNLEKVFDKFYQVDSSSTRTTGGLGLGLAIARDIINAHRGKIWVESEGVGRGSRFCFTLPIA